MNPGACKVKKPDDATPCPYRLPSEQPIGKLQPGQQPKECRICGAKL